MTTQANNNNNNKAIEVKKSEIIDVTGVEVAQPRTVQDFKQNLDKANGFSKLHNKYIDRIKEITEFKDIIADGGSIQMTIQHASGLDIEFPQVKIIADFIDLQLQNGQKELVELETEIKNFRM